MGATGSLAGTQQETIVEREWDVDGYFVGTVQDQPVNCRYRFRVREGRTEVQIGEENRQIAVSL